MDEHGTNLGAANNTKVIGEAARSIGGSTHRKMPENREWVSVLEMIGLGKHRVPPVVIFKGKYSQTTWFPLDIASLDLSGWRFACSENGWTSNDIALEWFEKVFLPYTTPDTPTDWRLLIVDGHGSRVLQRALSLA
ncbi:DDE-domain-containing protein [Aulographum hederae CBS 113979]|uniref:DDE-domain-containing protein n=1 Tax=Aulographum hederae CBS 113979 TaxID=1176131 RepID=A0A6G1GL17_9PEZI|nr:DDE-domain-containing protein [Aulographum hederae CBS 113979]